MGSCLEACLALRAFCAVHRYGRTLTVTPPQTFCFPKSRRLRKRADFLVVQRSSKSKCGKTYHGRYFVMVCIKGVGQGFGRLGITVSKKVGNAAVRNRIKRVTREFARNTTKLHSSTDVVTIARKSAAAATTAALWADLASYWPMFSGEESQ